MQKNLFTNSNTELKRQIDHTLAEATTGRSAYSYQRIDEEEYISPQEFEDTYVKQKRPVVLKGGMRFMDAFRKWDLDFFAEQAGDVEVVSNLYDVENTSTSKLGHLIAGIQNKEADYPIYLQEWWFQHAQKELLNDILVPEYFANDQNLAVLGYMNHTLWIGQAGAFTPIHQDTVHANVWTGQIRGKKQWVLIDPTAEIHPLRSKEPDIEGFFAREKDKIYQSIIEEGDILYVPHKWWHRAETLTDSVSLNTFYITPDILSAYLRDILSIPLAASLNSSLLQKNDPMRYNVCVQRSEILANNLGLNAKNILGIDISGAARSGIYAHSEKIEENKERITA